MIANQLALVRRELWEHKSLYVTPAVVALVLILTILTAFVFASGHQEIVDIGILGAQNIAGEGEMGRSIYFIVEGSVEIISADTQKSWGRLGEGDYFGFMSMVLGERRTATTRAIDFCDLLILDKENFNRIKAEFPEFNDVLKQASAERTDQIAKLVLEGIIL